MKSRICRYCDSAIPANRIGSTSAVCANCGLNNETETPKTFVQKYGTFTITSVIILSLGFIVNRYLNVSWSSAYAVSKMSLFETEIMRNKCIEKNDKACVIASYRRLIELQPEEPSHQENLDAWLAQP